MKSQREGWLGEDYVRVYAASDRARVAEIYDFRTYLPGYTPVGSWGLDALCLAPDSRLYLVDWIPLAEAHRRERYRDLAEFESELSRLVEATTAYEHFQKEVHFVTPIVFGASPTDAPVMIDQGAHSEFCRWWNKLYRDLKKEPIQQPEPMRAKGRMAHHDRSA